MTQFWQTLLTVATVLIAAAVVTTPAWQPFTLQVLAASVIAFFGVHRLARRRQISFRPETDRDNLWATVEIALLGVAILLLIGSTGGFRSWWVWLYFIYFLFLSFVCPLFPTLVSFAATLVFFYLSSPEFGTDLYGSVSAVICFAPVAWAVQKYYTQAIVERDNLQLEREKVAYYNLYAEKQQGELLAAESVSLSTDSPLETYVADLIPQIDELQKMSRFPQNQLVVSSQLTKIALNLRQILKKSRAGSDQGSNQPQETAH